MSNKFQYNGRTLRTFTEHMTRLHTVWWKHEQARRPYLKNNNNLKKRVIGNKPKSRSRMDVKFEYDGRVPRTLIEHTTKLRKIWWKAYQVAWKNYQARIKTGRKVKTLYTYHPSTRGRALRNRERKSRIR